MEFYKFSCLNFLDKIFENSNETFSVLFRLLAVIWIKNECFSKIYLANFLLVRIIWAKFLFFHEVVPGVKIASSLASEDSMLKGIISGYFKYLIWEVSRIGFSQILRIQSFYLFSWSYLCLVSCQSECIMIFLSKNKYSVRSVESESRSKRFRRSISTKILRSKINKKMNRKQLISQVRLTGSIEKAACISRTKNVLKKFKNWIDFYSIWIWWFYWIRSTVCEEHNPFAYIRPALNIRRQGCHNNIQTNIIEM